MNFLYSPAVHLISGKHTEGQSREELYRANKVIRRAIEPEMTEHSDTKNSFSQKGKFRSVKVHKQSQLKGDWKVHSKNTKYNGDSYDPLLEYEYDYAEENHEALSHLLTPSIFSEGPVIDHYHSSNVTALAGVTTTLNCRVHLLGNKTVSWIRGENLHLLTVGRYTYTSDLRFEAHHVPHSLDWNLILRNPQPGDSGLYQCQVSSTPHLATDIWLNVKGNGYHSKNKFFHSNLKCSNMGLGHIMFSAIGNK